MRRRSMIFVGTLLFFVSGVPQKVFAEGKKIAVMFGANGRDVEFQRGMDLLGRALGEKKWRIRAALGENVKEPSFPMERRTGGTSEDFLNELRSSIGALGRDDQLFINIFTHGRPAGDYGAKSHIIRTADSQPWFAIDDPRLIELLRAANKKGIRVGIMDLSCFSGGSIEPLSKYGCVLTSQTSDRATYISEVHELTGIAAAIASSRANMGNLFLTMLNPTWRGFEPQISGLELQTFPETLFRYSLLNNPVVSGVCQMNNELQSLSDQLSGLSQDLKMASYLAEANTIANTSYGSIAELMGSLRKTMSSAKAVADQFAALTAEHDQLINKISAMGYSFEWKIPDAYVRHLSTQDLCRKVEENDFNDTLGIPDSHSSCVDREKGVFRFKANPLDLAMYPADACDLAESRLVKRWEKIIYATGISDSQGRVTKIARKICQDQWKAWGVLNVDGLLAQANKLHARVQDFQSKMLPFAQESFRPMRALRALKFQFERDRLLGLSGFLDEKDKLKREMYKKCESFAF